MAEVVFILRVFTWDRRRQNHSELAGISFQFSKGNDQHPIDMCRLYRVIPGSLISFLTDLLHPIIGQASTLAKLFSNTSRS